MKKVLALILALVMALSLVACGKEKDPTEDWGPEPEGTIEVTIWTFFGETVKNQYQEIIDAFNASQTKYHVTCEAQGSQAEMNAKIASTDQSELPAMFHGAVENVAMYANEDYCVPLQEFIDLEKKGTWKELDDTWKAIRTAYQDKDGKQIGYPQGYSYPGIYYNKDMFREAGLDAENPPATMEELYAAWDKLIQKDGNGNVTQYAQAIGVKSTVAMMPVFMWAYGADYIKDGKSVLDSDEATAAMTMIADAYAKGVSPVGLTGQEADDLFAAGKAAIEFNGQWAAPGFRAAGIDLGIAEVPAGMDGRDRKTWGGDSIMCMSADSKVKEAAWDFMEYWNGKEAQKTWALNVGFIPSRLDMADDEEILTGNPDLAIFMKASTYAQMFMADQPMSGRIDEEVLVPLYESVSRGTAAPADALKKASKALDAILAE